MPEATFLDATELVINMGPQHPSTHGVLRVILKLDGEKVNGTECVIGYLHRGVEKIGENRTYQQFAPYVDRMDYVAAVSNGLGYCLAVEKLLNVEAPPRAQAVRVILTELNRIASHLLWLGTHALDIGAITPVFYCLREREEVLKIFENYCGARLTTHAFRIGGLQYETYDGFEEEVKKFCDWFIPKVDEYEELLTNNRIWVGRLKGVGVLSADECKEYGVTGRCCARPAWHGICARRSHIPATSSTISKSPRPRTATPTTGTRCAWRRCGSPRASCGRRWIASPAGRSWARCPRW
jgi:NADH-quinone oxidoreductase subunit D